MTENKIKEMLNGIINNGEKWEYTHIDRNGDYTPWKPYKLGDEIHADWEYRKCEVWYVISYLDWSYKIHNIKNKNDRIVFQGSKEECEKWVEHNAKKTWLEETLKEKRKSSTEYTCTELDMYELGCKNGIIEVCKKILEEVDSHKWDYEDAWDRSFEVIDVSSIHNIIKDLGVEL